MSNGGPGGVRTGGGRFGKASAGLEGKFDNVRRKWEDELLRAALRANVTGLVERKRRSLQRLRVVDLGCGRGEGFELLTESACGRVDSFSAESLVEPEMLSYYAGVDMSNELVRAGNGLFKETGKVLLKQGDLREGPGLEKADPPFDLFLSTYGTLSHLTDSQLESLLVAVAKHSPDAIIVADVMGRFSYEWPSRWSETGAGELNMEEYTLARRGDDWEDQSARPGRFPLRFWSQGELEALIARAARAASREMRAVLFHDRSVFVGRHMDTRGYNPYVQPARAATNMLLEPDIETDLRSLVIDYVPTPGFERQNAFFEKLQVAWNTVVKYACDKIERGEATTIPDYFDEAAEPVAKALRHIDGAIESVGWMSHREARANIIEPQLAYALRNLEADFQAGEGMGHFLLCVIELGEK